MNERVDKRPDTEILDETDFVSDGEVPVDIDVIPGVILMDPYPAPRIDLSEAALQHIKERPWILEFAKNRKADIGAVMTGRGREIIIAAGGVGVLVAAVAGVVIYRHTHQENKPEQKENDIK